MSIGTFIATITTYPKNGSPEYRQQLLIAADNDVEGIELAVAACVAEADRTVRYLEPESKSGLLMCDYTGWRKGRGREIVGLDHPGPCLYGVDAARLKITAFNDIGLSTFLDLAQNSGMPVICQEGRTAPTWDSLDSLKKIGSAIAKSLAKQGVIVGNSHMLNAVASAVGERNWGQHQSRRLGV